MKNFIPLKFLILMILSIAFVTCDDDDDDDDLIDPTPTGRSMTYDLNELAVDGISGTAKFTEFSDNSTTVEIELQNTPDGGQHPAHIHFNTAAEGGDVAVTLGTVDGSTGKSSINIKELNNGSSITYEDLLAYDGYINVHLSADDLATIVAQGDIGQNALTGESKSYDLVEKADTGISGSVTFYERENAEALAVISLQNTPPEGSHPAHIHDNDAATGGDIVVTFNPVNGDTGMSKTNVATRDSGEAFGYSDILEFNGHVNVHLSVEELSTIVAQGNIGSNEDTPVNSAGDDY